MREKMFKHAKGKRGAGRFPAAVLPVALGLVAAIATFAVSSVTSENETASAATDTGPDATRRNYCERALQQLGHGARKIASVENTNPLQLTLTFAGGGNITCEFIDPAILSAPVVRIGRIELNGQRAPDDLIDRINIRNSSEERKRR